MNKNPKIVIIGAGFGGITMAKSFKNKEVDVLLIDQHNYHNFQPLMYQVATAGLEPNSIAYPVRRIFRKIKNVSFRMADVTKIDVKTKLIETSIGTIQFDYLIIATGSKNAFFNLEPVKDKLLTLKSIPDALNIRSYILQNMEKATSMKPEDDLETLLNIAIVGGGPSGIEMAGALAEMKKFVFPKDFPNVDTSKMVINLYEASPRLLNGMSKQASEKSLQFLEELGVNVILKAKVKDYKDNVLYLEEGDNFNTETVIWAAGVQPAIIEGLPQESLAKSNRILVDVYNKVLHTETVFAIGDVAAHITEENPKGLPMLAPVAQQQGITLSKNILRLLKGESLKKFKYNDKGTMATIGRNRAVVDLPPFKFQGAFAWFVWMFIHIFSLVGFRNKLAALFDWADNYFSYDRPLGLIIRTYKKPRD